MNSTIIEAINESIRRNGKTVTICSNKIKSVDVTIAWQSMRDGDDSADTATDGDIIWGWDSNCDDDSALWTVRIVAE